MNFKKTVKEYSSKKLKLIIEEQASSYDSQFIDNAKDELIKRGETFKFNEDFEKEIKTWENGDLKNLVEKEYDNYHLEYLEIARLEYINRGFTNQINIEKNENILEQKYPALRNLSNGYYIFSWILGLVTLAMVFYLYSLDAKIGIMISTFIIGVAMSLGALAASESIIVIIDIEENTRKHLEQEKD
jgi:hypothetical protein